MEEQSQTLVFLSYSNKDREKAELLKSIIESDELRVLYDSNLVDGGDQWRDRLSDGNREADCIIALISPHTASPSVMNELGMARAFVADAPGKKILIPILIDDTEKPEFIQDIQSIRWTDNIEEPILALINTLTNFFRRKFNYNYALVRKEQAREREQRAKAATSPASPKPEPATTGSNASATPNTPPTAPPAAGTSTATPPPQTPPPASLTPGYWLLKMTPQTWYIDTLKVGSYAYFNTYFHDTERPEYPLFARIKENDLVLGFASGSIMSVVCVLKVTKTVYTASEQGEIFEMEVVRLVDNIRFSRFKNLLDDRKTKIETSTVPPELFFDLSKEQYDKVLAFETEPDDDFAGSIYDPTFLTEGNHRKTQDKLGFTNDINSFASIICLEKVKPPLAIGLFGNWGTGKSFFMEKLFSRIKKITKSDSSLYVKNVVQVRFNSWHYSDTNLWASMITEIFESLNSYAQKKKYGKAAVDNIYKSLNITSKQLEATEQKIINNKKDTEILEDKSAQISRELKQKKKTLELWTSGDIIKVVLTDPFVKHDIDVFNSEFHDKTIRADIDDITAKLKEAEEEKTWMVAALKTLSEMSSGKWLRVVGVAAAIALTAYYILPLFVAQLNEIKRLVSAATGLAVAALAQFAGITRPYLEKAHKFVSRLRSLKERIDNSKSKLELKQDEEKRKLENEIGALETKAKELKDEKTKLESRKNDLQQELNDIGSGKVLAGFLAGRSSDDAYLRNLGIISWIRKDFARLDDLFRQQREARKRQTENRNASGVIDKQPLVEIDRIVLYIDDLDRCNEDVVVKVLEAIHLLLAFELFVVVVGVDPRWLNNALTQKYKTLFGGRNETVGPGTLHTGGDQDASSLRKGEEDHPSDKTKEILLPGGATSYDYLEKIFQIPFSLKPITAGGRQDLISYLLKDEMEKVDGTTDGTGNGQTGQQQQGSIAGTGSGSAKQDRHKEEKNLDGTPRTEDQQAHEQQQAGQVSGKDAIKSDQVLDKQKEEEQENTKKGDDGDDDGDDDNDSENSKEVIVPKQNLVITRGELEYLQHISPLFGHTPRTINRYVNIYRIIKAHGSVKITDRYSFDDYAPIMFHLAVIVGFSDIADDFINKVVLSENGDKLSVFLAGTDFDPEVTKKLQAFAGDLKNVTMKDFKRNLELVSRFSFRTLLQNIDSSVLDQ